MTNPYYVKLPALNANAMADFSGLNKAIDNFGTTLKDNRDREQRQEVGNFMAQARYGDAAGAAFRQGNIDTGLSIKKYETELSNTAEAKGEKQRKAIAGFIQQHIITDQDPASRAAKWQKFMTINPNAGSLPKAYHDPMYGPNLILSEAGIDPLDREGKVADIDYKRAQTGKLNRAGGGFESVKDRAGVEEGLRKEYAGVAKPYFEVRDAYTRVEASARDPSAAGDLALIFNYMKMLDPGSVVREGEFATAQNAAGVPDQVRNMFNRLLSGERMNPAQRDDFVSRARQLYQGQEQQYLGIQNQYRGISERLGVDTRNTILDYTRPQTPGQGGLGMPDRAQTSVGGVGQIPPGAVRMLQSDPSPEIIRQFEEKYGVPANQFLQGR